MRKGKYAKLPRSFKHKPKNISTDKEKEIFIREIKSGEYIYNFANHVPLKSNDEVVKLCHLCINKDACVVNEEDWCEGSGFYPRSEFKPKYKKITKGSELAASIGFTYKSIAGHIARLNECEEELYRKIVIKKSSGGKRVLYEPERKLKMIQKAILSNILYPYIKLGDHVTGFYPSRNISDNALVHVNRDVVFSIDIKDFFPSVHPASVYSELRKIFSDHVAMIITRICSYKNQMAQGIPTSPFLANLSCKEMDKKLLSMCKRRKWSYTRYADDMTFSTYRGRKNVRRYIVDKLLRDVYSIVGSSGFTINSRKTRIMRSGKRQMVTGIIVNEKANLPKRLRNNLRAIIHNCSTKGIDSQLRGMPKGNFIRKIDGYMSFMKMVNKPLWEKYIDEWIYAKEAGKT